MTLRPVRPVRAAEPQALKPVDEWLENYRRLWEQRLDRLEDYLRELQAKQPKTTQPKSKQPKESKRGRKK